METTKITSFSNWSKILLWCAVVVEVCALLKSLLGQPNTYDVVFNLVFLVSVIGILLKQRWGVIALYGVFALNFVCAGFLELGTVPHGVFYAFLTLCLQAMWFHIILLLRKDGRTTWSIIFDSKKGKKAIA